MRIEAEIYQRMGDCPYIPKLIAWEAESCSLTLENMEKGDLATYAASAIVALHALNVIYCNVTPRNLLLNGSLDLHIADFAGSSVAGSAGTIAPGPRFRPPDWSCHVPARAADDVFALGSVLYFIMTGEEPYSEERFPELEEQDVEWLFEEGRFPQVSHLICEDVIRGCWEGSMATAEQVFDSLAALCDAVSDYV